MQEIKKSRRVHIPQDLADPEQAGISMRRDTLINRLCPYNTDSSTWLRRQRNGRDGTRPFR